MHKAANLIRVVLLIFTFTGCILFFRSDVPHFVNSVETGVVRKVDLSFSVVGDIHGDTSKLKNVIWDLYEIRPDMDAMVLNGDSVNKADKKQYDSITKCLRKNFSLLPDHLIINIGNHEFYDSTKVTNTQKDVNNLVGEYLQFSDERKVYHDTWINGYHFISLGSEVGNTGNGDSTRADITEIQQIWLERKLSEKYVSGKPIFVFLHQNIGSNPMGWIGVKQLNQIKSILTRYPEVIIFTSHTHLSLKIDNLTLNQPFTIANVGAVKYITEPSSNGRVHNLDDSQGIYVEVNGDKTTIKGRDFRTKSWIFSKDIEVNN